MGRAKRDRREHVLADCTRCGRPVQENHSHVMIVPVGRGRMFYHAACEPPKPPDHPKRPQLLRPDEQD